MPWSPTAAVTNEADRQHWTGRIGLAMTAYVLLLPIQLQGPGASRFAPSDLALFFYWLTAAGRARLSARALTIWHWLLPCLFLAGTATSLFLYGSVSSYALLQKLCGLFILLAAGLAIATVARDWESVGRIVQLFVAGVVAQNWLALLAFALQTGAGIALPWINYDGSRLSGLLIDPNAYGGLLVAATLLHIVAGDPSRKARLSAHLTTLSLLMGVVLTFSRSAWLGLALGLCAYAVMRPRAALGIIGLTGCAGLAAVLVFGRSYLPTMLAMAARPDQIAARLTIIADGLDLFAAHPLAGVGLGAYLAQYGVIVHNTLIWFLVEFGLPGIVVIAGFLGSHILRGAAARQASPPAYRPLTTGLLATHIALIGLSIGIEALYQRHWWLIMSLLGSAYAIALRPTATDRAFARHEPRRATARMTPVAKRLLDLSIAIPALILLSPVILVVACAVAVAMGRPVFFRQWRPGLRGRPFRIIKFRTMREALAPDGSPLPYGERVTRLGRILRATSLDELPELLNVIRGEMSLVGPRPLRTEYLALYTPAEARRHEVLPGITGLAQVNGRNAITWQRRFELDVWYVDHWSPGLDLKILWLTVATVITRSGVNRSLGESMPAFAGSRSSKAPGAD